MQRLLLVLLELQLFLVTHPTSTIFCSLSWKMTSWLQFYVLCKRWVVKSTLSYKILLLLLKSFRLLKSELDQRYEHYNRTVSLLEEKVCRHLDGIRVGREFMKKTHIAKEVLHRINSGDLILLKSDCTSKENTNRVKSKPTEWGKISPTVYQKISMHNIYRTEKTQTS